MHNCLCITAYAVTLQPRPSADSSAKSERSDYNLASFKADLI
jgi:hypothetical protein